MNRHLRWDDLKIILAIADTGSLSGAGRRLGLSHATVFRHHSEIETRLGVELFHRARTGYTPTVAGEEVANAARRIEAEVLTVERRVAGQDLRPSGTVRITTTDSLLTGLISPILAQFGQAYPQISLEIAVSNQLFSLSKREAEVAIRPSSAPPEALVGRRVGRIVQAVYAPRDVAAKAGRDVDIHTADWVGPDERMAYRDLDHWLATQGLAPRCRYRVDTVMGMFTAVQSGIGLAVLPCYLGDADPRMVRIGAPVAALSTDLWLLTHPDLRKTTRVRAVLDFIAESIKHLENRLHGEP